MPTPKPRPPFDMSNAEDKKRVPIKRPFVPRAHLTQRPFLDDDRLQKLRSRMQKPSFKNR